MASCRSVFTSPRVRGEVDRAISAFTRVFDALWRGRVRGRLRESELAATPPHPDPFPARGARERAADAATASDQTDFAWAPDCICAFPGPFIEGNHTGRGGPR